MGYLALCFSACGGIEHAVGRACETVGDYFTAPEKQKEARRDWALR